MSKYICWVESRNDIEPDNMEKFIIRKSNEYFSQNKKFISQMIDIIDGRSAISIRVLDWFITNYSKKYSISYKIKSNGVIIVFTVDIDYKNQLSSYSKKLFDPFCRDKKIAYIHKNMITAKIIKFETSIGQLNFFRWAIKNKVLHYISLHLKEIEKDMKETIRLNKELKIQSSNDLDGTQSTTITNYIDPEICSTDELNTITISSDKKSINSDSKSSSSNKKRRRQLVKSIYEHGIKKSNVAITLEFD